MVELLVTLAISTLGLVGVLALHKTLTRGVQDTEQTQEALAFGSRTLESLRAMRVDTMIAAIEPSAAAPPFGRTGYASWTGRTGTSYQADVQVTEVPGTAGLWRLRIEVHWTEGTEARRIPLEVLRTMRDSL